MLRVPSLNPSRLRGWPGWSWWWTSGRSRVPSSCAAPLPCRAGPGCARHGRRPGGRWNRPGCTGPRRCSRGRGSRWAAAAAGRARPAFGRQAKPMIEQGGPVAEGNGQPGHRRADRLAGVHRRRVRLGDFPDQPAPASSGPPRPSTHAADRAGHRGSRRRHVQRPEREPVLRRGGDARLMAAEERDSAPGGGLAPARRTGVAGPAEVRRPGRPPPRPPRMPRRRPAAAAATEPGSGRVARRGTGLLRWRWRPGVSGRPAAR